MNIHDVNPYIRYCEMVTFDNVYQSLTKAYDCRIFYALDGDFTVVFEDKKIIVSKNGILYIPPNKKYYFKRLPDNTKTLVLNFDLTQNFSHITQTMCPDMCENFDNTKITEIPDFKPFDDVIYIRDFSVYSKELMNIYNEFRLKDYDYLEYASGVLKMIIIQIDRARSSVVTFERPIVQKIISFINLNYMEDISQELLHAKFHYHPYYINRLFVKFLGTTIHKYIISQRIHAAKQLIMYSDKSFEEIAFSCGFKTQSHFSQVFKKQTGISPTEFRQQNRRHFL